MEISINNAPDDSWQDIANVTIEKFIEAKRINPQAQVSVFFVSKEKIRALNNKYRKVDSSTDVLSFPVWESLNAIPKNGAINLGDIFICPEESSFKDLEFLINHSLDHLVGKHH